VCILQCNAARALANMAYCFETNELDIVKAGGKKFSKVLYI
jgi:hypothetical protein